MKISIIGAGFVGATTAYRLVERKMCHELILLDKDADMAKGKALDLMQAAPSLQSDVMICGTGDYQMIENSDIIIISAGFPRVEGMSRDDLLYKNAEVVKAIVPNIVKYAPKSILICVTNPLDAMTYLVHKLSGFDSKKVIGMAGLLDTERFRAFIAEKLQVSASQVQTIVLGTHGAPMVPIINHTFVAGRPLVEILPPKDIDDLVQRTINAGAEIISYLKTGSAYFAPAGAIFEMTQAIVRNQRKILPASGYLCGQYGFNDIYLGVPLKLNKDGISEIIEINLTKDEQLRLEKAAEHVKKMIAIL
ncbi:malate dehydrogenase [Candidatus Peregrinibacteria bacterium RIFOXYB2_FULL_32_7]|nr:MAG: malate dehydrogenase [Candidatus Peregrinibacteria bacterium RIFOXYB2_FULL_32_7]